MRNSRGQLKIQQMIFMIIAVTLFFAVAGMFILMIALSDLGQRAGALREENARLLVSKISESPEFSCGNSYGTASGSCIDLDKVINLKSVVEDYGHGSFWGIEGLEIVRIYPEGGNVECNLNNYPDCGKITIIDSPEGTGVSNFVSLCHRRSVDGRSVIKCSLGRIVVVYQ